ncbi:uncharacterized protein EAF01_008417 [Botrytis porri]|uniref:uncharacterized protein n=1 Tax=Botrytis porri TaxID=87229 RepID=UPI0019020AF9|nr:uncharacterized protein EAF01_008417 [Botrytis porri]KAF7899204.1 hypothetical protein EAF01_008417 [Botrytis porri]
MAFYENIWGERQFFDLSEADNNDEFPNLWKEGPFVLVEDNIEEDEGTSMAYNKDQVSNNVYSSYSRETRDREAETQSIMPIDTEFEESVGNIPRSTTSLSLAQRPTIDSPGIPSQHYQNHSVYATMPPSFNTISNTIRRPDMLQRSSALSSSFSSDKDNRHEYKHREDVSYSMMISRPSSSRREKNSIDKIIEDHNKRHAGKLGVTPINSKPLASKVIQKKPTKRKGHKYSGSLEGFMVECQDQHSGSRLSGIYQEYQLDRDESTQSWMFEEQDSFQQMGQMEQILPTSTSFQHMGQKMIDLQWFNSHCQSLSLPQNTGTQQPIHSFQQIGHAYYDQSSYPFNYISVLDEPHLPLFPERNLWATRATDTSPNQSHYQFQMPAVQTQDFGTQQYTTVRNGYCATVRFPSLHQSFGSERGSGRSSESSTSPSLSPCQSQTCHTHSSEKVQEWNRKSI